MDCIREKYLTDSTVTIVLVGKCTWARKFVDWEVYSSLRNDKKNRRSGLMAITLPSASKLNGKKLPERVNDNVNGENGDARWWQYPTSESSLRNIVEIAYAARTSKANLIDNSRTRRLTNSACP
ncbi:MAG: TIR domain-containing protein [Candidatus Geothermincolia bacterium]